MKRQSGDDGSSLADVTDFLDSDDSVDRYMMTIDILTSTRPVISNQALSRSSVLILRYLINNAVLLLNQISVGGEIWYRLTIPPPGCED